MLTLHCGGTVAATDASIDATPADGNALDSGNDFVCGDEGLVCNKTTEYCYIVISHVTGFYCKVPDGGAPSCDGYGLAPEAGVCGCHESDAGEVTVTECGP